MSAGRKSKLTPEIHKRITAYIRAGAYDWVAAQACGVGKTTFYRWLEIAEQTGRPPYREFRDDLLQARAEARVAAEVEVRKADPKFWLRCGPGKDRPGEPGWTEPHEITGQVEHEHHHEENLTLRVLGDPVLVDLIAAFEERLAALPTPASGNGQPGGMGAVREPGDVEAGAAPGDPEPPAAPAREP